MEQVLVYPALHPADDSIKTKDQLECKELIIDIQLALQASRRPDKYCIYRVPKRLRDVNNKAYTPRLVSIGPFHHRSEELKDMDTQKFLILKGFCDCTKKIIEELKYIIRPKEMEIRSCYSETFLLSGEGFLNMILLDAIFILELFLRKYDQKYSGNLKLAHDDHIDYILSQPCMERGIQHDLLLLENQLPFFVLDELYQNAKPNTKNPTLLKLSCWLFWELVKKYFYWQQLDLKKYYGDVKKLFDTYWEKYLDHEQNASSKPKKEVKHFTDLVRCYYFCPIETKERKPNCCKCTSFPYPPNQEEKQQAENKSILHLYGTATKLEEAGLKFTKPFSKTYLLDIKFRPNECLKTFLCFNLSWLFSFLPCLKGNFLEHQVQRVMVEDKFMHHKHMQPPSRIYKMRLDYMQQNETCTTNSQPPPPLFNNNG